MLFPGIQFAHMRLFVWFYLSKFSENLTSSVQEGGPSRIGPPWKHNNVTVSFFVLFFNKRQLSGFWGYV